MTERPILNNDARRFFGVSLSPETATLLTAAAHRKGLTTTEFIERLCVAAVVKDAEARA